MKLPRHLATTAARGSGLVRADVGAVTATGDAGFGAIAKLGGDIRSVGGDIAAIQRHKQKISDNAEIDRINKNRSIWIGAKQDVLLKTRIETPADQVRYLDSLEPEYDKMIAGELKGTSRGVQSGINNSKGQAFAGLYNSSRRTSTAKIIEHVKVTKTTAALDKARAGDVEGANEDVDYLLENVVIGDTEAAKLRIKIAEVAVTSAVADIKKEALNPIYNEDERAELFDNARGIIQGSSLGSEDELAEIRSINLLEEQLIAKDKRDRFASNVDTTATFTENIRNETLTLDEVRTAFPTTSKNDTANVKKWQERIKGSLKPPATVTSGKGAKTVSETMLKISTGEKDALSAYNDVLDAFYIDRSIDKQTFDLAVKRINSPYPEYLATLINNTLSEKEAVITSKENSLFFTKAERKRVQEKIEKESIQLFKWIDKELEANPDKIFTPKEIHNMQAQVSVTATTPDTVKPLTEKEEARRQELMRKRRK